MKNTLCLWEFCEILKILLSIDYSVILSNSNNSQVNPVISTLSNSMVTLTQ